MSRWDYASCQRYLRVMSVNSEVQQTSADVIYDGKLQKLNMEIKHGNYPRIDPAS